MPRIKIIGFLVLEKKIFKGFDNKWMWRPPWSCYLNHLYKLSVPLSRLNLALIGQAVSEEKTFEIVDDGRRRTPEHWYTISSHCEPEGSDELISCLHKPFQDIGCSSF